MNDLRFTRRTVLAGVAAASALKLMPTSAQDSALSGELSLWHGWTGAEADTLNNDILPAWAAANPDVSVEVLAVPFDQLKNKYQTESATGGGPDILIGPLDWVGELATAELIQAVDAAGVDLSVYLPTTVAALTWDGSVYGVPESFEAVAMYYNTSQVAEAPATTAELDTVSASIAEATPGSYGLALLSNFYHPAGYLFGFGAKLFDENNMSALDSPETAEFLTWINGLQTKPGYFLQNDDAAISSLFKEGKAAVVFNGPWALGDYQGTLGAENVAVAPLPLISEKGDVAPAPFLGLKHLMINYNSTGDQATLAGTFASWFTGPDSVTFLAEKAGHLPAHTGVDVSANPVAAAFVAQAESATPLPTIPEMGQVWTPAEDMISKVLSGDSEPAAAAAEAASTINSAIEQMGA